MKYENLPTRAVTTKSGKTIRCRVALDAYWLWWNGWRYRWALIDWPDDGFGTSNHGAERSLRAAVGACERHREQRRELE